MNAGVQVTDLLYQKQSQVERVTAERAAQQMAWERELAAARDTAERTQRSAVIFLEFCFWYVHLYVFYRGMPHTLRYKLELEL